MKRVHPNLSRYGIGATIALCLVVAGCRSTSSGVGGPFLAPDRVPPPATRALLPGQAQPYYPGDPLPAMQTATAPPANSVADVQDDTASRSASGRTLAWAQPGGTAPTAPSAAVPPTSIVQPSASTLPPQPIATVNEGAVAVPVDGDSLRFPLPAPREPENITPIAAATPQSVRQAAPPAPTPLPPGVQLASFNAPIPSAPVLPANPPVVAPPPLIQSPWRSPQIAPATTSAALPAPPISVPIQPQAATPANPMSVRLRAVPSPPQPGDAMPRVRAPGYIGPQVSAADGFRPRTSMQ